MRTKLLVLFTLLGVAGCATEGSKKVAAAPLQWCNPCVYPDRCTAPCAPPVVAAAKPAPAPAPPPAPAPKEPAMAVTFSPAPGTYESAQSVALTSDTPGATIHYTTDGSTPGASSPTYSGPITVDQTTTLRAIAMAEGIPESRVTDGTYKIEPPKRVEVTKEKLELKDKIYFDTGKSTIKPVSYSLLDEVAKVLNEHGEVKKVRIEGHTDNTGSAKLNTKLSDARAKAVRAYLEKKGVASGRLDAKGYGPSRPAADNATPDGREKNRRVEFMIE
jgi:OmpA-OmpF porin, OOP family